MDMGDPISSSSLVLSSSSDSVETGFSTQIGDSILVDGRNKKQYRIAKLGSLLWMLDNLNYGSVIRSSETPSIKSRAEGSCPLDQDTLCETLGMRYQWAEALDLEPTCNSKSCLSAKDSLPTGICPDGWRLPRDQEWLDLANYLTQHQAQSLVLLAKATVADDHAPFLSVTVYDSLSVWAWGFYKGGNNSRSIIPKKSQMAVRCTKGSL